MTEGWPDKELSAVEFEQALEEAGHVLAEVESGREEIARIILTLSNGRRLVIASVSGGDIAIGELPESTGENVG